LIIWRKWLLFWSTGIQKFQYFGCIRTKTDWSR